MDLIIREKMRTAKHIWIYGAGKIGKEALRLLNIPAFRFPIAGVAVSHKEENPDTVGGWQVYDIGSIMTKDCDTIFVIAVSEKNQPEIVSILEKHGYHNYFLWHKSLLTELWMLSNYTFVNRSKGQNKVCFVLSGYKKFLWDNIFTRLYRFAPEDVDICILSSGLRDECLEKIAETNGWSYLSTEINDITLIQNIAIKLFEKAEWIYKMDEDIFVTEGCFEHMYRMYHDVCENGHYRIGFVAPLIPVNGYGHIRILNYFGKIEEYERRFGKAVYGGISENKLEKDAAAAAFMWGNENILPHLDELNRILEKHNTFSVCGVRFSIGFILFHRSLWRDMEGFPVSGNKDFGVDEVEMCKYCMLQSRAIVVSENTAVGHFSFGQQTEGMRRIYETSPELFTIRQL